MATSLALPAMRSCGHTLDEGEDKLGLLTSTHDALANMDLARERMEQDNYLLLRGLLDKEDVLAARRHILEQLAAEEQLDPSAPLMQGVPRPGAQMTFRPELAQKNNPPLQHLLYNPEGSLMRFFATFLKGAILHFDFTWLRCISPGNNGTPSHCDIVYMGRGTHSLYTAWVPLGETDFNLGGLMILEGSHGNERLRGTYGQRDVDQYCSNRPDDPARTASGLNGWLSDDPNHIRRQLGGRWLTAEYNVGDVVIFSMHLVHGGMDNRSERLRLSSDSRYQLAGEPVDERWIGENPPGHGTAGKRGRIC
jgi:ectoine hydroxylase-related dioxygenase (phytanoyl-CoA dioxygenase family)